MVHALHEARRVLKPEGALIDLRPAAVHRRVGLLKAGQFRLLGVMRERFDDDHAANRAVVEVVRNGLFKMDSRLRFECYRTMDRVAEFGAWLNEFVSWGKLPSHAWLLQRVEQALGEENGKAKIAVSAPLDLRVLKKTRPFLS
ncbi:MAG: hypothetical protein ACT4QE_16670, partial [Anaerolineales bacterium]